MSIVERVPTPISGTASVVNMAERSTLMESVLIKGDLAKLTPQERSDYYLKVCQSVGINPLTKPFEYITLNGRLRLYATRDATDQLRKIHGVSVEELTKAREDESYVVTCKVRDRDGRADIATGVVHLGQLKGEALANAKMKAETKAKRRATLSLCGLGFLDETEIEDISPNIKRAAPALVPPHDPQTGEVLENISDEQVTQLITYINEVGADQAKFLAYLKVASLDALPASRFNAAVAALEAKRKAVKS